MDKWTDLQTAVGQIRSGDHVLVGGFGLSGSPLSLIDALCQQPVSNLTIVSNNLGEEGKGLGKLLRTGQLKKVIGSYFTSNREAVDTWLRGELYVELIPQGTLAEAIRAGGAGIGGFFTKTAVGTMLAENKEIREFHGERYLFQEAITADVSLIKAHKADRLGNLTYLKTANNFNQVMATAGKVVIAEVDEIVETGELNPEDIQTPHLYVDFIVKSVYIKKGGIYVVRPNGAN